MFIRRLVKLCAFGLLFVTIYRLFSPWTIVIEIRSASAPPGTIPDPTPDIVVQDDIPIEIPEEFVVNDDIEQNFGPLEESFQKLIREPPKPPKRSRDESIKLIYDIKSPNDWLDLVEGHDDHVCLCSPGLTITNTLIGLDGFDKSHAALHLPKAKSIWMRWTEISGLKQVPWG